MHVLGLRSAITVLVTGAALVAGQSLPSAAAPSVAAAAASASKPWQQVGADEGRSNWLRGESKLTTSTVKRLEPDYARARAPEFGLCSGGRFLRDPVATPTVLVYDDGRNLRAVDLATGGVKWTTASNDQFGNSPTKELAVADGVLVAGQLVGCESVSDPDGHLAGYDLGTGRLLWSVDFDPAVVGVSVSGSTVIASAWDEASSIVTARRLSTGAEIWTRSGCSSTSLFDGPVVVGGIVATTCGGLSLATGATQWGGAGLIQRGDAPSAGGPMFFGTTSSGAITARRPNGTSAWTSSTSGNVLAVGPSRLIVLADDGSLCGLNRTTGARLWRNANVTATRAVLVGAGLLFVDDQNRSVLDAATGLAIGGTWVTLPAGTHFQASNGHLITQQPGQLVVHSLVS